MTFPKKRIEDGHNRIAQSRPGEAAFCFCHRITYHQTGFWTIIAANREYNSRVVVIQAFFKRLFLLAIPLEGLA